MCEQNRKRLVGLFAQLDDILMLRVISGNKVVVGIYECVAAITLASQPTLAYLSNVGGSGFLLVLLT